MKKAPVVIKGNKSGIRIVLDDVLPFPEILEEVEKKFKESSDFLGEAQVAVSFDGRKLTEEQEAYFTGMHQGKFKITSRVSD